MSPCICAAIAPPVDDIPHAAWQTGPTKPPESNIAINTLASMDRRFILKL
jgi:hypothetical protein